MASTNSTSHYELSQYIGTDKPTYLVDYNGDMLKIDNGIYGAKSEADTNTASIGTLANLGTTEKTNLVGAINEVNTNGTNNTTNIGVLSNLTTTEKSNVVGAINEVKTEADGNKTNIGTMANLDTSTKSSLVGAVNEVKGNVDNFNLSSFTDINQNNFSVSVGTLGNHNLTIAKNSDGSLAKVYGRIFITNLTGQSSVTITITGSGLSPSSDITINNAMLVRGYAGTSGYIPYAGDLTIKTNGDLVIALNLYSYSELAIFLWPMLYWIKDFGDVPINS